jgi:predicted HD superfamily hydrolase involved in NAD metabolism
MPATVDPDTPSVVRLERARRFVGEVSLQEAFFAVRDQSDNRGALRFRARVESMVTPERFQHIMRVVRLAQSIAIGNGFDEGEIRAVTTAALLHDAARDLEPDELFRLAPPQCQMEADHPLSVHGRAGRVLAEEWGVCDERVLGAISGHVFGVDPEDRIGMAVYVADVSEPGRGVNDDIRELAICDLPSAYRRAVATKVSYLENCGKAVHPETLKVYEAIYNA